MAHFLLTPQIEASFKANQLYSHDGLGKSAKVIAAFRCKFSPAYWLVSEADCYEGDFDELFGYACITDGEFGYFSLNELESLEIRGQKAIYRDDSLIGKTIAEAICLLEAA